MGAGEMAQQLKPQTYYSFRSLRNHVAREWEWVCGGTASCNSSSVYINIIPIIRNKTNFKIFIYTYVWSDLQNVLYPDVKNFHSTILT